MTDYKIIQTINGPEDVKKLSMEQLEELTSEIREALFNRLTKIGGHFGPNFGMVEAEIAIWFLSLYVLCFICTDIIVFGICFAIKLLVRC